MKRQGAFWVMVGVGLVLAGSALRFRALAVAARPVNAARAGMGPGRASARERPSSGRIERTAQMLEAFEANHGQTDRRVKFLARGRGYTVFLTATEAVLALYPPSDVTLQPATREAATSGARAAGPAANPAAPGGLSRASRPQPRLSCA
jgi:hypothetical protein